MSDPIHETEAREGVDTMPADAAGENHEEPRAADAASENEPQEVAPEPGEDPADDAFDDLTARAEEIEAIEVELEETKEQLMRQAASFQNFRRRTQQELSRSVEQARADVMRGLLDVVDDFHRTMESLAQLGQQEEVDYRAAFTSLKEGVELVYRKLGDDLQRLDVEPIEAVGHPFDEHLHEAMMQQPAPEGTEPGTVLQEVQRGYRMGDRILRHSKVVVAA